MKNVLTLLQVTGLEKKFGGHYALQNISLTVEQGEVHALVGENGAGKSTFIKILTGVHAQDEGKIIWQGHEIMIHDPKAAQKLGINVIHQERHLIPSFTGLENVFLGSDYPRSQWGPGINWRKMRLRVEQLASELGIEVPIDLLARNMTPPQQTLLEILRAMLWECKLLFLDEPTAALTDLETERLFQLIARLKSRGTAIIYVSHRMDEIFRLSDRITVLRNGQKAGTLSRDEASSDSLISLMTGGEVNQANGKRHLISSSERLVLEVKDLATLDGKVKNANFHVRSGEVVGIFGLAGSGRTELLETIYGLRAVRKGEVIINGQKQGHKQHSPGRSLKKKVVMIPENRRAHGIIAGMSIRENMTLPILSAFTSVGVIQSKAETTEVIKWMEQLKLKATGFEQRIEELSGGNQQKVVFAKALMVNPDILLCDEPTQGVDIRTRSEIHKLLRSQAEEGRGVVYVSSDLKEVLEVTDRLIVMHNGEMVADLPIEGLGSEDVLRICYRKREEGEKVYDGCY